MIMSQSGDVFGAMLTDAFAVARGFGRRPLAGAGSRGRSSRSSSATTG
ncbi:hypothetical protein [Phytohabitans houttuyneae]|nr:hypothetical protein [Phytohabitans houttuyneae]